jgi:hypothetical protein
MKAPVLMTMFAALFTISAAAAAPQLLSCKLSYVTHTGGSEPQEYTYAASTQMGLIDAQTKSALVTGSTNVATFVAKLNNGLLEMHVKESDTGHEAMSVGPLTAGLASKTYLVTDRTYTVGEDMTQIELSCSVKDLN